jgi:hypothetical protein
MRRVDPTRRNLATEVEWRHHGYVLMIDTVRSGGRRSFYNVFDPDERFIGEADSLREGAKLIEELQRIGRD